MMNSARIFQIPFRYNHQLLITLKIKEEQYNRNNTMKQKNIIRYMIFGQIILMEMVYMKNGP